MDHQTQIKAEVESVTFHNDDNGWTVFQARDHHSNFSFTATGHFSAIFSGEAYELFGFWREHPKFGKQFKASRALSIRPTSRSAIIRYLSSGLFKGIGEKTAEKIVMTLGTKTLDIMDNKPHMLSEVPSLGKKKVSHIIASWNEQRSSHDLLMFLSQYGISHSFSHKIKSLYGSASIEVISENPYRLATDISGIGFISADKIAQSMGIHPESPQRITAAILYQLKLGEEKGHCFLTEEQLSTQLSETLSLPQQKLEKMINQCLEDLISQQAIVKETETLKDDNFTTNIYFLEELHTAEVDLVKSIKELTSYTTKQDKSEKSAFTARVESWITKYCEKTSLTLSEQQISAIKNAALNKFFILTGGPGVGKTTTANAIIKLFKAMNKTIALTAPTGRAAQRITEVSSFEAKTIHRLLEWAPHEKNFLKNELNPLTAEVVIIDESSMIDIRLAQSLFKAIPPSTQVILIGDVDQLPSVGPGNVLRDLIDSESIPTTKLTEIFRQAKASDIIRIAHAINQGETPSFTNEESSDCRFIEGSSPQQIKNTIKYLLTDALPKAGYDPMKDVQILTPMNRGDLGTVQLNEELQDLLNPSLNADTEYKRKNFVMRTSDKVIQSSNNYDLNVFNGDIGYIEHTNANNAKLTVNFQNRLIPYDAEQAFDLRLAYSITIHKSQGSEFPVVIIPISMQHYIMLQRNLIYTALTRAKKIAIFVGATKALAYASQNQESLSRQTRLKERLFKN